MIGASSPKSAKISAMTSLCLATAFAVVNSSVLLILRNHLGMLFTKDPKIIKLMARVIPILALFQIADGYAAIGAGVLRGCGKQRVGAFANLIGYYVIGIPIALALCFAPKVQMGVIGLWTGLCIGLFICSGIIIAVVFRTDWHEEVQRAESEFVKEVPIGDIELGTSNTTTPLSYKENEIECDTPILFSKN
jgi:MATE family multidrug resistance protein